MRSEFFQLCLRRTFKEGEFVFCRNDPRTGMYFIEEDSVELIFSVNELDPSKKEGFVLESPDSFGVLSIGCNLRRKSSVKCITSTTPLAFLNLTSKF